MAVTEKRLFKIGLLIGPIGAIIFVASLHTASPKFFPGNLLNEKIRATATIVLMVLFAANLIALLLTGDHLPRKRLHQNTDEIWLTFILGYIITFMPTLAIFLGVLINIWAGLVILAIGLIVWGLSKIPDSI